MDLSSIVENNRRVVLNVFLASIAVNAALGIWALLTDDFGQTEGKILATSFLVSAGMVSVLINGPAVKRRVLWPVPIVAAATAMGGFVLFIGLVWMEVDDEVPLKVAFSMMIVAAGGTLAGLLALVALRPAHEAARFVNHVVTGLLCATSIFGIWAEIDASWLPRLLGVESVLVAAMTLAIPALSRFLPPTPEAKEPALRFCPSCGRPVSGALLTGPVDSQCGSCGLRCTVSPATPLLVSPAAVRTEA